MNIRTAGWVALLLVVWLIPILLGILCVAFATWSAPLFWPGDWNFITRFLVLVWTVWYVGRCYDHLSKK